MSVRALAQAFQSDSRRRRIFDPWGVVSLALVTGAFVSIGCGQRYQVMTDWYSPPQIARVPDLQPVVVYLLADDRQEKDTQVGVSGFDSFSAGGTVPRAYVMYVSEPVAVTVTQAFADGLRARGFPVIDMTRTRLDSRSPFSQGQIALSGKILELRYEKWQPLLGGDSGMARCKVVLHAYDTRNGHKMWEKEYAKTFMFGSREPEREPKNKSALGQVVADIVAEAVYDPEFILAIGRKRSFEK